MYEIKDLNLLNSISGSGTEYVSRAEIMVECGIATLSISLLFGAIGLACLMPIDPMLGIFGAVAGALAGAYIGSTFGQFCGVEPGYYNIVYV
jgi:hypothetical protein